MTLLAHLLACFIPPVAGVLMWVNLGTRGDLTGPQKLAWGLFGLMPLIPMLYVLTGGRLKVARRDGVVSGPWCLLWYRLKGYVDTRQLGAAAEAAVREDCAEAGYYRAMTDAYADIMRFMNETEAALTRR